MTTPLLVALIPFAVASTACIWGNLLIFRMVAEINKKKPEDEQIGHFANGFGKLFLVFGEYKKLYPDERLAGSAKFCIAAMVVSLIATFACLVWANPFPTHGQ